LARGLLGRAFLAAAFLAGAFLAGGLLGLRRGLADRRRRLLRLARLLGLLAWRRLGRGLLLGGRLLGRLGAAGQDLGDPDLRQVLAVTHGAAVMLAPLLLEDLDLVAARLLDEFGGHDGAGDDRGADLESGVAGEHQHLVELEDVAGLAGQAFDLEHVVRLDAVLLAAGLDDCVHVWTFCFQPRPSAPRGRFRGLRHPSGWPEAASLAESPDWGSVAGAEYTANRARVKEAPPIPSCHRRACSGNP
jgi:hypothetical protein